MGREQRNDDQQRLYTLVDHVGLDNNRGKGDNCVSWSAAKQTWSSAAEERRRMELLGIGALADGNVMGWSR